MQLGDEVIARFISYDMFELQRESGSSYKPRGEVLGVEGAHSFTISLVSESMTSLNSASELRPEDGLDNTNLDDDCEG